MSVLEKRRRTYLRAADRRAQILEVAKRVFARRGYHVANVADICKGAKIGRGTLYLYFENKTDVLRAVMQDVYERVDRLIAERPAVAEIPGVNRAPLPMIVSFVKRRLGDMLDAVFVDAPTLRLILRDARGLDGTVDRVIAKIDERVLAAMVEDTRTAQAAGIIRKGDARLMSQFVLGGVEKMVLLALSGEAPVDLPALIDTAVEIQLFGLLTEEVRG
jgi:AcrR family transcriptional regulator